MAPFVAPLPSVTGTGAFFIGGFEMTIDKEFQALIPALSADELQGLEESILAEGCRDALVFWNDILVDGHNRYSICTKHGIDYRTVTKDFESRAEVKYWIRTNQLSRRNLNDAWKLELELGRKKDLAEIGQVRRKETEGRPSAKKLLSTIDSSYSPEPKHDSRKILAEELGMSTGKVAMAEVVMKKNPALWDKAKSGEVSINQAYKEIKKDERTQEIKEMRKVLAEFGKATPESNRWRIFHGDIQTWNPDKQYDWIITDPPYPKEFLPLWEVMAERARDWLKPGGILVAMSGQSYLDQIYAMMSKHLDYYWTASYLTPGQPTPLRQVNVNTTWKPLLIYANGKYTGKIFGDVFKSEGNDKDMHKWGQSESGMYDLISKLCLPGQSILDPFCGAGTTGVAAIKHGCFFDGLEILEENVNISKGRLA